MFAVVVSCSPKNLFPTGTRLKNSKICCSRREQHIARLVMSPLFLMQQTINGLCVVEASTFAGASLCYMLRNYGKGKYSCGNAVILK